MFWKGILSMFYTDEIIFSGFEWLSIKIDLESTFFFRSEPADK